MRGRQQLELTPSEYQDAQRRERGRILLQLEAELERAANHRAPWYMWILWRRNREHRHGLRSEKNEPVACPVPGCDEGHAGLTTPLLEPDPPGDGKADGSVSDVDVPPQMHELPGTTFEDIFA